MNRLLKTATPKACRNLGYAAIAALILSVAVSGQRAEAQDLKIGAINVARLLDQAPQSKSAMEALQDEFAPRQRDIVAKQKSLREKEERLQRDGDVLGQSERTNLERDVRDERRDLGRDQNEYLEDLNLRRNEVLGKLQRSLLQEVQAYARAEGYDLVLSEAIFASSTVDITPAVLKALEESYKSQNDN